MKLPDIADLAVAKGCGLPARVATLVEAQYTVPAEGASSAPRMCKSVLFPAPDWPTIATISPRATVKSSPWNKVSAPRAVRYVFSRLRTWMMGELSCTRKFDSRMKRRTGLAAAGVVRSIRSNYLIAKIKQNVIAKVTCVRIGVTLFASCETNFGLSENIARHITDRGGRLHLGSAGELAVSSVGVACCIGTAIHINAT